jgi:hypothetical protein
MNGWAVLLFACWPIMGVGVFWQIHKENRLERERNAYVNAIAPWLLANASDHES